MSKYLKQVLGPLTKQPSPASPPNLYTYKTRFSMLGTVGSGKSTIASLIVVTTQTLSSDMPDFYCRVVENTSQIIGDASRIRSGMFPEKTTAYNTYAAEAGLLLRWAGMWGDKKVQIPICDIAGEDIQHMIQRFSKNLGEDFGTVNYNAAANLVAYVKDSDGFVVVVPASKAVIKRGGQVEKESAELHFDPDVNLHRILNEVVIHKEQSRGRPIKGIAVIISKWDLIQPFAESMGLDVYTAQGLRDFMDVEFPATSQLIKSLGMADKVQYFPSYVDLERDNEGNPKQWGNGSPMIKIRDRDTMGRPIRRPSYPEQQYVNLIGFLKGFAA